MTQITPQMIKALREKSGAGMMACKTALDEAAGDAGKALEIIRKMGLAKGEKKAHRSTREGQVAAGVRYNAAVLLEVLCETDFAAKNARFSAFVTSLTEEAVTGDYTEGEVTDALKKAVEGEMGELVASVGENIQVRRVVRWAPQGKVHSYIHDGGGIKLGVLVDVEGECDDEYGHFMAMQIAAANPQYIRPEDVPAEVLAKEREIAAAQPGLAGKPAEILDKIIEGKVRKWITEVCLTKQTWVHDDKTPVEKVNPKAKVLRFLRWQVGEEL